MTARKRPVHRLGDLLPGIASRLGLDEELEAARGLASSLVASRALGPGMAEPTTMKSTPLERVFDPVDGRVTLTVSAEVDSRSRSLIRPCWISSRVAMGGLV